MTLKLQSLLATLISAFSIALPVKADTLTSWHFDAKQNQLNVTTDTSVQPEVKLIANPTRLVISRDLGMPTGSEMTAIKPQIENAIEQYKSLSAGMFFLDLDTGNYLDIKGDRVFPAASTIKLPILIAFFQDVDAGKVSLDETLVMKSDLVASGSGTMQDEADGTRFSIRETVDKMITISDNTATNMIIERLGGIAKLNERFRSWGLTDTIIRNWLGDFQGTNTTSSVDMVKLLAMLSRDKLVSESSREQALELLRRTTTRTLLPSGLGAGAVIADKTGDIGFVVGDAGIIDMPNGKRYLAAIFVKRPYNDPIVRDFVGRISRIVYNYLDQPSAQVPDNLR